PDRGAAELVRLDAASGHRQAKGSEKRKVSFTADANQRHVGLDARAVCQPDGLKLAVRAFKFGKIGIEVEPDVVTGMIVAQEIADGSGQCAHEQLFARFDDADSLAELGCGRRKFKTYEAAANDHDVMG